MKCYDYAFQKVLLMISFITASAVSFEILIFDIRKSGIKFVVSRRTRDRKKILPQMEELEEEKERERVKEIRTNQGGEQGEQSRRKRKERNDQKK